MSSAAVLYIYTGRSADDILQNKRTYVLLIMCALYYGAWGRYYRPPGWTQRVNRKFANSEIGKYREIQKGNEI